MGGGGGAFNIKKNHLIFLFARFNVDSMPNFSFLEGVILTIPVGCGVYVVGRLRSLCGGWLEETRIMLTQLFLSWG